MSTLSFFLLNCPYVLFMLFRKSIKNSMFRAIDNIEPYLINGKSRIISDLRYFFQKFFPFQLICLRIAVFMIFFLIILFFLFILFSGKYIMCILVGDIYIDLFQMGFSALFFFFFSLFFIYLGWSIGLMLYIADPKGKRVKIDLNVHLPDRMAGFSQFGSLSIKIVLFGVYILL